MSPGGPNSPARRTGSAREKRARTLPVAALWRFTETMCSHRSPRSSHPAKGGPPPAATERLPPLPEGRLPACPALLRATAGCTVALGAPCRPGGHPASPGMDQPDAAHCCRVRWHRRAPALPSHIPGKKAQRQESKEPGRSRHCRAEQASDSSRSQQGHPRNRTRSCNCSRKRAPCLKLNAAPPSHWIWPIKGARSGLAGGEPNSAEHSATPT